MENVSRISPPIRHFREIVICPYLYDHHIEGKAVFPAVEALITLAQAVKISYPAAAVNTMTDAFFPRFLSILPDTKMIPVSVDVQEDSGGAIAAALLKPLKSPSANISRMVEYARVQFGRISGQLPETPFNDPEKLAGDCINVPAAAIYSDLVPFGAAYRNITGDLSVSPSGVLAYISGGNARDDDELLGSPFPFDAVLHAACVWGQRFAGIVSFPTGFGERIIYRHTAKRITYLGRVAPLERNRDTLTFNAWIYDLHGAIYEVISGIQMRDVSRGRMQPPEWIRSGCAAGRK
jgi:hypothetical protein